jgi:hypothetical protein
MGHPSAPLPPRSRPPAFRPRGLIAILYLLFFFFAFGLLLVAPELLEILREVPPGPEQQEVAEEAVHTVFRPRLPVAAALALLTTALGSYYQVLPGLRALDVEGLFDGHHELDDVEGIGPEIVENARFGSHLARVHAKLIGHQQAHTLQQIVTHGTAPRQ